MTLGMSPMLVVVTSGFQYHLRVILDYFVTSGPNEPSVEEVRCVQTSLRVAKMMFEYWIDLPDDDRNSLTKKGNIDRAELYVHVKPAFGGTFSDIANVDLPPLH
ncbi:unnamed protein product [Musa acuminata subsp. burmannicoides]